MHDKKTINSYKLMTDKPNWKRMPDRHKKKSRRNQHKTGSNEAPVTLFRPKAVMHCLPLNHRKICIFNESSRARACVCVCVCVCAVHMDDS